MSRNSRAREDKYPFAGAQSADKFYFWVTQGGGAGRDSFVIELDAAQKAQTAIAGMSFGGAL